MLLKNRVALITGSGRGIGRAVARLFADEGALVFLTARTEAELASTSAEINKVERAAYAVGDLAREGTATESSRRRGKNSPGSTSW